MTYFFNGGREEAWPGETRILVPSPRDVPSYDFKPEMSADEVAERVVAEVGDGYASASSTSRTPTWSATPASSRPSFEAVETADAASARVVERVTELGGVCLITADHGNAEKMLEADGVSPQTAHTTNPVPLIVTRPARRSRTAASSPIWRRRCCICSGSSRPRR